MAIHIIKQPDVRVTEAEVRRLREEYRRYCQYHVSPCSFEEFVRANNRDKSE